MADSDVIESIVRNNPSLLHLSLSSSDISDAAAAAISETVGPQLQLLDLSWCDESLTHKGVDLLARSCYSLRLLNLRLAFASRLAILCFVAANPNLETLLLHGIQKPVKKKKEEEEDSAWNPNHPAPGEEDEEEEPIAVPGLLPEDAGLREGARSVRAEVVNDEVCRCIALQLRSLVELDISFNLGKLENWTSKPGHH